MLAKTGCRWRRPADAYRGCRLFGSSSFHVCYTLMLWRAIRASISSRLLLMMLRPLQSLISIGCAGFAHEVLSPTFLHYSVKEYGDCCWVFYPRKSVHGLGLRMQTTADTT